MNSSVLFVDDNADHLSALAELLEGDYDVQVAPSGDEALSLCEDQGPFALVVAVQETAGMSGVELLTRVGERWPATERILMSAETRADVLVRAVNEARVFHYLETPVAPDELHGVVLHAVAHFQAAEEERLLTEQLSFARESLISMTETLESRLGREMRRMRAVEDLGSGLVNVRSIDTIGRLMLQTLVRVFEGRAVRIVLDGQSFSTGDNRPQPAGEVVFWREPILAGGSELGEVFIETEAEGPTTGERRALRLVGVLASLGVQASRHYGKSREAEIRRLREELDRGTGRRKAQA